MESKDTIEQLKSENDELRRDIKILNLRYDVMKDDYQNLVSFTKKLSGQTDILLQRHNNLILYKAYKNIEYYILYKGLINAGFNYNNCKEKFENLYNLDLIKAIKYNFDEGKLSERNKIAVRELTEYHHNLIKDFGIIKCISNIAKILHFNNDNGNNCYNGDKRIYYHISIYELENACLEMSEKYDKITVLTYKYSKVYKFFENNNN